MIKDLYTQYEVAELLGVNVRTLRQWRLTENQEHRTYLKGVKPTGKPTGLTHYTLDELLDFCRRNPRYGAMALYKLELEETRQAMPVAPVGLAACLPA